MSTLYAPDGYYEGAPESDQWKLEGKCSLCRKLHYCGKPCRATNEAMKRMLMEEIAKRMLKPKKEGVVEND